jgi:uncharacterized protein (DUF1778 family)
MTNAARKPVPARIEFRVTQEQKRQFERAAAVQGRTLTEFLLASAEQSAAKAIQDHDLLQLRGNAQAEFISALLHPPEPNEKLETAFERYAREVEAR